MANLDYNTTFEMSTMLYNKGLVIEFFFNTDASRWQLNIIGQKQEKIDNLDSV